MYYTDVSVYYTECQCNTLTMSAYYTDQKPKLSILDQMTPQKHPWNISYSKDLIIYQAVEAGS